MRRIYDEVMEEHLDQNRQILFLVGSRQVGKTTTSLDISAPRPAHFYLNWDIRNDSLLIIDGPDAIADFEVVNFTLRESELAPLPTQISDEDFKALLEFGGFPEPFLKRNKMFYNRWKRLRQQQLFEENMRDLTRIHEMGQMQILAELLKDQAGQLTSYTSLANKVNVSVDTIKRWLD
jgi:predicted AAA+ superfamily ATPase